MVETNLASSPTSKGTYGSGSRLYKHHHGQVVSVHFPRHHPSRSKRHRLSLMSILVGLGVLVVIPSFLRLVVLNEVDQSSSSARDKSLLLVKKSSFGRKVGNNKFDNTTQIRQQPTNLQTHQTLEMNKHSSGELNQREDVPEIETVGAYSGQDQSGPNSNPETIRRRKKSDEQVQMQSSPYLETSPYGDDDYGPARYRALDQIVRPDPPLTDAQKTKLAEEWGRWEFHDPKAGLRPSKADDYCAAYSNRDIPREKFPANAWQTDPEFLEGFLEEGIKLVDRGMEAILSEYGRGKDDMPGAHFRTRSKVFSLVKINVEAGEKFTMNPYQPGSTSFAGGAEVETKSWDGIVRRVLHAIMTNDEFGVVLGGHSVAQGAGNHFKQSYIMQFHKVAEPVFALLGVTLKTRYCGEQGRGTLPYSLGARDLFGKNIDLMLYHSVRDVNQPNDPGAEDIFFRQALLSGDRVPVLMGEPEISRYLNQYAGADIGHFGQGNDNLLLVTQNEEQVKTLPFAIRYLMCEEENMKSLCAPHRYEGQCWVEEEWDHYTPTTPQLPALPEQTWWHRGNRENLIIGRSIAFTVFRAIKEALEIWKSTPGYALSDEAWHVTSHYESIRNKVKNLPDHLGHCHEKTSSMLPKRICTHAIRHAVTGSTPRPNPDLTDLQTIIVRAKEGYGGSGMPHSTVKQLFDGPGPHNPILDIPEGQVDVLAILSNGRDIPPYPGQIERRRRRLSEEEIEPGLGWYYDYGLVDNAGYCDGTWNMECQRVLNNGCLLYGHGVNQGGLVFGGLSGWLVMNLTDIRDGIIMLNIKSNCNEEWNALTKDWTTVNGKPEVRRRLGSMLSSSTNYTSIEPGLGWYYHSEDTLPNLAHRRLYPWDESPAPEYCDEFRFEYAIDGEIKKSMNKEEFQQWMRVVQRVTHKQVVGVEIGVVMDDPDFAKDGPRDLLLAIRQLGCARSSGKAMKLTHVYWS